ncbi:MAG: hypothetical protein LT070_03760 [Solirubrobacteraceae bacterium]|nr:hypothetical protein [Solirubrobacteraceae bacterium]
MFTGFRRIGTTAVRRVALAQAAIASVAAVLAAAIGGRDAAVAVLYGALAALAVTAVLAWREAQALRHPEWDQRRLFGLFIRVGIERLLLLAGLLGVGLGVFRLAPLPLLLGLLLAQLAWVAAAKGPGHNNK